MNYYIDPLTLVTFFPVIGIVVLLFLRADQKLHARWVALITSLITFGISLAILVQFNPANPDLGRRVEHLLLYGCGWLEYPLNFTDHVTDVIIHPFHLDCGTRPGEGIHDIFPVPRNGNAGSFPGARSVLILRLLGIHTGADVYVNRHMGW